jgi:hypothetical protein
MLKAPELSLPQCQALHAAHPTTARQTNAIRVALTASAHRVRSGVASLVLSRVFVGGALPWYSRRATLSLREDVTMTMGEKSTVLQVAYDLEAVAAALTPEGKRSALAQQLLKSVKALQRLAEPWPATDGR